MGGSSGGSQQPVPAQPQPIDISKLYADAAKYGAQSYQDQLNAQIAAYPKLEKLQLGTIGKLANNLNDAYTKQAKGVIDATYQQGATALADTGNRINALGDSSAQLSSLANKQALDNLALGTSLNPEEERIASQQASAAYAARGLGTGAQAANADLLNRYQYGQARYQQRLQNAVGAQGMLGNTANLYGQAGGAYQNAANLGFSGANALVNLDPYQRALGTGVQLSSGILGQSGQMIGNAYNGALDTSGNTASFNTNMQASMYNGALNNNAALGAANAQARATQMSGLMGLGGSALGAAGGIGGSMIIGAAL